MGREQEILNQFAKDALQIQSIYRATIANLTENYGKRPEYEELLTLIKRMHTELVKNGKDAIQNYHQGNDTVAKLTEDVHKVIADTVSRLIKAL